MLDFTYMSAHRMDTQKKKDKVIQELNGPKEVSLEEEIIRTMAPVGKGSVVEEYVQTAFKPVHDKISGASMIA